MEDRLKVRELPSFVRDPSTRAIINTDRDAYEAHMLRKRNMKKKDAEITELKAEVSELKSLVQTLVDKIDG